MHTPSTRRPLTPSSRTPRLIAPALLLLVGMVVPVAIAPAPASANGGCVLAGDGTDGDEWIVANADDLAKVGVDDCGLDGHYLQTADITLTGTWTPIGAVSDPFTGTYDGGGFTISGMTSTGGGMFVDSAGTIRRVHLIDVNVTSSGTVGGLVVGNDGTIEDSSTSGVVAGGQTVGGLVGANLDGSIIRRSSSSASVTGTAVVGGLVGLNRLASLIEHSFATGPVEATGSGNGTGGLVGDNWGEIRDSYARGSVNGQMSVPAGGLVALSFRGGSPDPVVRRSFSTGAVSSGQGATGGLLGAVSGNPPTLEDLYWDKVTSGQAESAVSFNTFSAAGAKSTAEMKNINTFANWTIEETCERGGFDPNNSDTSKRRVWGICPQGSDPTINDGYPFLLWVSTRTTSGEQIEEKDSPGTTPMGQASTPVRSAGTLPAVPVGTGEWQRADGTTTPLSAASTTASTVVYRDADATVTVTLSGAAGSSAAAGLVADAAGEIVFEVCLQLAAGSVIEAWMFSAPRLVAAHRVIDAPCQRFTIPVVAPLDGRGSISPGAHTLQIALPTSTGMEAVNIGITVGGPVPTVVPAGEGTNSVLSLFFGMLAFALAVTFAVRVRASSWPSVTVGPRRP